MLVVAASAAACAQVEGAEVSGVLLAMHPFEQINGIYVLVDIHAGWPRFRSITTDDFIFFRKRTCEWILHRDYDPDGNQSKGRVPCERGMLPLRVKPWMSCKRPREPQTIVLLSLRLVTPAEVQLARETMAAGRDQAQAAVRTQLQGVTAVVVEGARLSSQLHGRYVVAPDHAGWPHFTNERGMHLFRHLPASAWRICPHLEAKPHPTLTVQVITKDGTIPTEEFPSWFQLQRRHWNKVDRLTVTLERTD